MQQDTSGLEEYVRLITFSEVPAFQILTESGTCSIYYNGRVEGFPVENKGTLNQIPILVRYLSVILQSGERRRDQLFPILETAGDEDTTPRLTPELTASTVPLHEG